MEPSQDHGRCPSPATGLACRHPRIHLAPTQGMVASHHQYPQPPELSLMPFPVPSQVGKVSRTKMYDLPYSVRTEIGMFNDTNSRVSESFRNIFPEIHSDLASKEVPGHILLDIDNDTESTAL